MSSGGAANYGQSEYVAEEIEFLLTQHQGVAYIAHALGSKPTSIERRMRRAGRLDLARIFRTQSTIVQDFPDERTTR